MTSYVVFEDLREPRVVAVSNAVRQAAQTFYDTSPESKSSSESAMSPAKAMAKYPVKLAR